MEELKNLKKTSREGQEGWGKAMMGQMQAEAAMDPGKAAKTAQGNMQTAELALRQTDLAHKIQAALSKWEQKMTEIEPKPDADALRKSIETQVREQGDGEMLTGLKDVLPQENATTRTYREAVKVEEDKLKAMQAAYSSCPDLNFQKRRLYTAQESYCTNLSAPYLNALNGYRTAVVTSLPDAAELDKVQMEIQKIQFGVEVPPEQRDMAGLGLVQGYIKKLRTAYMFDLTSGPYEEFPCDGKLGR
jgi:multidrug efflux pump subunit AcrB